MLLAGTGIMRPALAAGPAMPALRELAARRGLVYGSCAAAQQIVLAPDDFTALLARECALIVPENEMKWAEMSDGPGQEDYSLPDRMVAFAQARRMAFRGHTMLWYWRTPGWFSDLGRAAAEAAMLRRVTEMATRYRGRIYAWDVVNEPVNPQDGRSDGLRRAVFLDKIGPAYLDLAYRAARAADPGARLVLNEYDVEYDTPLHDAKRAAVLRVVERMKAAGTPLDAVGIQGHLSVGRYPFSPVKLRRFLAALAGMGLQLQVTELDVTDELAPADIAERDRLVADEYARFLDVALAERAVKLVVTWGLSDRHSWIVRHETNTMKWRTDGTAERPLPFDAALRRKPAWYALASAFAGAPHRDPG